jgi:hypothetical protein
MKRPSVLFALCALMTAAVPLFADEAAAGPDPERSLGFGFEINERFFIQTAVDSYSGAIADSFGGYMDAGTSDLFGSYGIKALCSIPIGGGLELDPFVNLNWAPKIITSTYETATISLLDMNAGVDAWWLFSPGKRFSLKAGLGAYVGYSSLSSSGDGALPSYSSFPTCGVEPLFGGRLSFRKLAINFNLGIPIEILNMSDSLPQGNSIGEKAFDHISFFFSEGVSFYSEEGRIPRSSTAARQ